MGEAYAAGEAWGRGETWVSPARFQISQAHEQAFALGASDAMTDRHRLRRSA